MIKCRFIRKGFIDPRRSDEIIIHFDIPEDSIVEAPRCTGKSFSNGIKLRQMLDLKITKLPHLNNKFHGRESWFEVDGFSEKLDHFSGNGPCPEYPIPEDPPVTINFYIGVL